MAVIINRKQGNDEKKTAMEAVETLVAAMSKYQSEFAVIAAGNPAAEELFYRANPAIIPHCFANIFRNKRESR